MIYFILDIYALLFSRRTFSRFNKLLFLMGARGLGILNYKNAYLTGEGPFLRAFLKQLDHYNSTVVDVVANSGQFAAWVIRNTNFLKVVSFEPHPASIKHFQDANLPRDRVELVGKGLSSEPRNTVIYDYSDTKYEGSQHASLNKEVFTKLLKLEKPLTVDIVLSTLDCEFSETCPSICLLKIDVEGHELSVLRGGSKLLHKVKPPAILIEFNEMNAVSGTHYRDLVEYLGGSYLPFRLLPGGGLLPLDGQSPLYTELYAFQNIVF
jgi:FkbM family methyltransferase